MSHSLSQTQLQSIEASALIHRLAPVLSTVVAGQATMMDMEAGVFFGLDPIGTDVWQRLEQPMTLAELAADLSETYAAEVETIKSDVSKLLLTMAEHGLVEFR